MKDNLAKYSNFQRAQQKAYRYLGKKKGKLYRSTRKEKKYMVKNPATNKWVYFGQMGYSDFTKYKNKTKQNKTRRKNYLARATHIRGKWKTNKFSPNNLAIHILW
jgi:hypothetical protein